MEDNKTYLTLNENGEFCVQKEIYATIECETEEDFKELQKELEFAKKMRSYHIQDINLFSEVMQMGLTLKNANMDMEDLKKAVELFKNK